MKYLRKSSYTEKEHFEGRHRFEHWYRDNTVYFITSKVRDGLHAFRVERAKQIFWDRFTHWSTKYDFEPWVVSLLDNHYHILGFLPVGENLGHMMQKLHGSTSKLVNDVLPERHLPFCRFKGKKTTSTAACATKPSSAAPITTSSYKPSAPASSPSSDASRTTLTLVLTSRSPKPSRGRRPARLICLPSPTPATTPHRAPRKKAAWPLQRPRPRLI